MVALRRDLETDGEDAVKDGVKRGIRPVAKAAAPKLSQLIAPIAAAGAPAHVAMGAVGAATFASTVAQHFIDKRSEDRTVERAKREIGGVPTTSRRPSAGFGGTPLGAHDPISFDHGAAISGRQFDPHSNTYRSPSGKISAYGSDASWDRSLGRARYLGHLANLAKGMQEV